MNLIARAERDMLWRALVAATLVVGVLILATTISKADPTESVRITATSQTYTAHQSRSTGAGRPAGCPRLWGACWARLKAGVRDTKYNLALAWLDFQRVVAVDGNGNPVIESGNHNGRVGTATYPAGRIVAYVVPR